MWFRSLCAWLSYLFIKSQTWCDRCCFLDIFTAACMPIWFSDCHVPDIDTATSSGPNLLAWHEKCLLTIESIFQVSWKSCAFTPDIDTTTSNLAWDEIFAHYRKYFPSHVPLCEKNPYSLLVACTTGWITWPLYLIAKDITCLLTFSCYDGKSHPLGGYFLVDPCTSLLYS